MQLPKEFIDRIEVQFGEEASAFLDALDCEPITSVRFHPRKYRPAMKGQSIDWEPLGLFLDERPIFTLDPYFHAGHYYVQEASSMYLGHVLQSMDLPDHPVVLDACAAPGGKSTQILSHLDGKGVLIANEILKNRAQTAADNLAKWGYLNFIVTSAPTQQFRQIQPEFDLIVTDAPCSGEGLFRRDPKATEQWSLANAKMCSERQADILDDLWPLVKPGGYLIYSTCTFNPDENERQIERLLKSENAEFIPIVHSFSEVAEPMPGMAAFYPNRSAGEGFFIAVIRKKGEIVGRGNTTEDLDSNYFTCPHAILPFENKNLALSPTAMHWMKNYGRAFHIIKSGLTVGEESRKGFIPHNDLSYSPFYQTELYPIRELDHRDALRYLKGESLRGIGAKGYHLVTYQKARLGWVKEIGNRTNNAYPKYLRIRMDI
jgi:16S rRNA C967 or C1407 C5-methylase (RsmB/RsmF family)/NOL1/NOP2/fmu family ribosome biogenesis protein